MLELNEYENKLNGNVNKEYVALRKLELRNKDANIETYKLETLSNDSAGEFLNKLVTELI